MTAHNPPVLSVPTAAARGVCEVVVFTQDATASLGALPRWHIELLIDVWPVATKHRQGAGMAYGYLFENCGGRN